MTPATGIAVSPVATPDRAQERPWLDHPAVDGHVDATAGAGIEAGLRGEAPEPAAVEGDVEGDHLARDVPAEHLRQRRALVALPPGLEDGAVVR